MLQGARKESAMRDSAQCKSGHLIAGLGKPISFMDLRLTSNAAATAKIGNPEGCFLADAWRRCSSVRERCGYLPSSRLASRPPENSASIPYFDLGSKRKPAAFTLVELLVVVAIIAVLAALLLPALTRGKKRAQRVECISDLKQLGLAFQMFAHDHQGRYPMQVPITDGGSMEFVQAGENITGVFYFSYKHFQTLANELVATKPLVCPADLEREAAASYGLLQNSNVSYFVGVNADYNLPMSILAGDRNITNNGYATASLVRGAYGLRWTSEMHVSKGNILFSDAHVGELNNDNLDFSGSPLASSTFFLPAVPPALLAGSGSPPPVYVPPGQGPGGGGGPNSPPGGGGTGPTTAGSGQSSTTSGPGAQTTVTGASGAGASGQLTQPATPRRNNMAMARTANNRSGPGTITEVYAGEMGAAASTNVPPRAAVRGPDDEPEPPLLWLMGTARAGVAEAGWWWLPILLLLLAGLYVYSRLKMRRRAKTPPED
jgi:prepilin-type N-terminal cleavage/methylation domain-containing protein